MGGWHIQLKMVRRISQKIPPNDLIEAHVVIGGLSLWRHAFLVPSKEALLTESRNSLLIHLPNVELGFFCLYIINRCLICLMLKAFSDESFQFHA